MKVGKQASIPSTVKEIHTSCSLGPKMFNILVQPQTWSEQDVQENGFEIGSSFASCTFLGIRTFLEYMRVLCVETVTLMTCHGKIFLLDVIIVYIRIIEFRTSYSL